MFRKFKILKGKTKMSEKLDQYERLLGMDYKTAINSLLKKYGLAQDSYVINEKSYDKFLRGEIKHFIKSKKISRSNEGLYCHHICEDKYYNLSNEKAVFLQQLPFSTQAKGALVYCDLIEHAILHVLINPNDNPYSDPSRLINNIKFWYIDENIPTDNWLQTCYTLSKLSTDEAKKIYTDLNSHN